MYAKARDYNHLAWSRASTLNANHKKVISHHFNWWLTILNKNMVETKAVDNLWCYMLNMDTRRKISQAGI